MNEDINMLIERFFLSRNYQPSPGDRLRLGENLILLFKGKGERVIVSIASEKDLAERNSLLRAVVKAVSLKGRADKVYIALPRLYASILDSKIIRDEALGLLIYDERGVEEAVPAVNVSSKNADIAEWIEEIKRLRREMLRLERKIESLSSEIQRLKSIKPTIREVEVKVEETIQEVPSFLKDNPWINILSQRGKEIE